MIAAGGPDPALVFRPYGVRGLNRPPSLGVLIRTVVADWPCLGDYDYFDGLAAVWPFRGDLVVVEHDVEAAGWIPAMLHCYAPMCAVPYRLYPASTALDHVVWSVQAERGQLIAEGHPLPEYAPYSGLGLVKIGRLVRQHYQLPSQDKWAWGDLSSNLTNALAGLGLAWHVHRGEAVHRHR